MTLRLTVLGTGYLGADARRLHGRARTGGRVSAPMPLAIFGAGGFGREVAILVVTLSAQTQARSICSASWMTQSPKSPAWKPWAFAIWPANTLIRSRGSNRSRSASEHVTGAHVAPSHGRREGSLLAHCVGSLQNSC